MSPCPVAIGFIGITNGHFIHAGPLLERDRSFYLSLKMKCIYEYEVINLHAFVDISLIALRVLNILGMILHHPKSPNKIT